MNRIWIDVEDLFQYALHNPRPTGIQRLAFEAEKAIAALRGDTDSVHFVRYAPTTDDLAEVPWKAVDDLYKSMQAAPSARKTAVRTARPAEAPSSPPPASRLRQGLRRISYCLPTRLREPLVSAFWLQVDFLRTLRQAARVQCKSWMALRPAFQAQVDRPSRQTVRPPVSAESVRRFTSVVKPGDILLVIGGPWWHPDHAGLTQKIRSKYNMRFGLLIYDILSLLHPEWCAPTLLKHFRTWVHRILPQADLVLAISQATARDVESYARQHGIPLRGPVIPIPIGTGFAPLPQGTSAASPDLPEPGSYVLFVSTIEARKNHLLLFKVWRRLLAEMPEGSVPKLVFAGRVGWLVADLMAQLANTNWLDGHVVLIENASDADLAALYRGCLFTLFPSFYEGWGLPVTESLAFGKPCITADNSSLPEAGGGLTRMFDADNLHDAVRVIRETLVDRPGLAAWEAKVRSEFHPVPWSDTASTILAACATLPMPSAAPAPAAPAPGQ